jgi:S1-C subfamily serine protease
VKMSRHAPGWILAFGGLALLLGLLPLVLPWSSPAGVKPAAEAGVLVEETPPASAPNPANVEDLKRLQDRIARALAVAQPAVVAVRHTKLKSAASGVIISADGLVLSQYHVTHAVRDGSDSGPSWKAGEKTVVILANGRECAAELLGATMQLDVSLLKIVEPGPFPFVPLNPEVRFGLGDWALKLGHPGHYREGRPASVRLGRVLCRTVAGFVTDCMINGGDSGGPFFDLDGRLVGIVRATTADLQTIAPPASEGFNRNSQFVLAATSNRAIAAEFDGLMAGKVNDKSGQFDMPLVRAARLPAEHWLQGSATRRAFRSVAVDSKSSVVAVVNGSVQVALGTVVKEDGESAWLLTKASELTPRPGCRLPGGAVVDAEVVGVAPEFDLAMLRVKGKGLREVKWSPEARPKVGMLTASVNGEDSPFAIGVVSIPAQDGVDGKAPASSYPTRLPPARPALLTHADPVRGFVIDQVYEGALYAAGVRVGDVVQSLGGRPVRDDGSLFAALQSRLSGDRLKLEITRGTDRKEFDISLSAATEKVGTSPRSNGFPSKFEHASLVLAHECGGPILDLEGRVMGITIARFDLIGCKALPVDVLKRLIPELQSGKLKGNWKAAK